MFYGDALGSNVKMSEVNAAMGLAGLEPLGDFTEANRRNYRAYRDHLSRIPGISVFPHPENEVCNYPYAVVTVNGNLTGLDRDALVTVLEAEKVFARRYFRPACHRMETYRSLRPKPGLVLPVTEELSGCVMTLPTGRTISPEDIERIVQIIAIACEKSEEIRAKIAVRQYEPKPARD